MLPLIEIELLLILSLVAIRFSSCATAHNVKAGATTTTDRELYKKFMVKYPPLEVYVSHYFDSYPLTQFGKYFIFHYTPNICMLTVVARL